jgi:hypothetical protein
VPITFVYPPLNGPIGPGYTVSVTSDFVGPIPSDAWWTVAVMEPGEEFATVINQHFPIQASDHELQCVVGDFTVPIQDLLLQHAKIPADTSLSLIVQLDSPTGVIEEETQTVKWDATGRLFAQAQTAPTLEPSFTPTDRETLNAIPLSMQVSLPTFASALGNVGIALAQLILQPPANLLCRVDPVDIAGIGTLTRPLGVFTVAAYGLYYELLSAPPELGLTPGVAIEWQQRLGQFVVIKVGSDGTEYRYSTTDFHTDHERVNFGGVDTKRIEYDIAPGVVIRVWWLVLCI